MASYVFKKGQKLTKLDTKDIDIQYDTVTMTTDFDM